MVTMSIQVTDVVLTSVTLFYLFFASIGICHLSNILSIKQDKRTIQQNYILYSMFKINKYIVSVLITITSVVLILLLLGLYKTSFVFSIWIIIVFKLKEIVKESRRINE